MLGSIWESDELHFLRRAFSAATNYGIPVDELVKKAFSGLVELTEATYQEGLIVAGVMEKGLSEEWGDSVTLYGGFDGVELELSPS